MPNPRFGSMAGSMYQSIGSLANKVMYGKNLHPMVRAGMQGASSLGMSAARSAGMQQSLINEAAIRTGRRVVGAGIGLGGLGMANKRSSTRGGYNPKRPVMPVTGNGQPF